ncbi:MAG: cobaltochelatase subunit CobN [Smithella sp.]|jgi:cobaltochelatase CobN
MRIFTIIWASYLPYLKEAAERLTIDLTAYSSKQLNLCPEIMTDALRDMKTADMILLYRSNEGFWDEIDDELTLLQRRIPVIVVGSDPSLWTASTVNPEIVAAVYNYLLFNGRGNIGEMLKFVLHNIFHEPLDYKEPEAVSWEGIYHPAMNSLFTSTENYIKQYERTVSFRPSAYVGILYSRSNWATGNLEVEKYLISALEKRGMGVIPVFLYSLKDKNIGNLSGVEVIEKFFIKGDALLVDGIVKLTSFFLESSRGEMKSVEASGGAMLMKRLNVPLFGPVISYYKNHEQWLDDSGGLGAQAAWSIAIPEFEGVIEPVVIGATRGIDKPESESYEPIEDRIERLAAKIVRWIHLKKKPNAEKKIAFILHNNPCASMEATIGAGAHLDALESVADILKQLFHEGYKVTAPANGKALIDDIMDKKAIAEFRWTTVEEIVDKGGTLDMIDLDQYRLWFDDLPEHTRLRMNEAWGDPPGGLKDGVPAAMVLDGKILVTGVQYGNAVICAQPKRGCAGAKCDGQVCKILHSPDVPPPHQYVATYQWLSRKFCADSIIHVGTHGNLEFLPGKSTGLSSGCFPDIGIDTMPHLYIYNADNPPEGTTAKRRSNAVLIDHMQTVMMKGELYGDLDQVEKLLEEYERYREAEPSRAHTIAHMIVERVKSLNLLDSMDASLHDNFSQKVREIHDRLSLYKNTFIPKGMHIFGRLPQGEKLADFIYAIARYENSPDSLRGVLLSVIHRQTLKTDQDMEDAVEETARDACRNFILENTSLKNTIGKQYEINTSEKKVLWDVEKKLISLRARILESDETAALLNGLKGGYIAPGPSGLITRGRSDVLPSGRNFYSLDTQRIPSPAAWETGKILANQTISKYQEATGRPPENIAFYWQCTDIMWSDGEGMAQMLYLLGVKPAWRNNGRVKGFDIIPLMELGRPRIDITVRVSGITRDNFPGAISLLDEAIQSVGTLNEPDEVNFVRKHTMEKLGAKTNPSAEDLRKASYRIFASMPGTYQAGTQLAVYASAWKTQKDLSDVFLYWNGYAYGKDTFGEPAHHGLKTSLQTIDLSFNRSVTDEYDLTGCCCYFGTHGGMINAARVVSGREDIINYYGDTREPGKVSVRSLTEEVRRIARAKILNPAWIAGMKEHGYKGAGEISKRVGRLYGWQATAKAVDDAVFDDVTRTFMMNDENRKFFEENNPWALEEMARRLIEAAERDLWHPAPDVQDALKQLYVEIEGWIEEKMGDIKGDFQGGNIDIITQDEVANWKNKIKEILG